MSEASSQTALIVLFNHPYERNIPLIRKLYSQRFPHMLQLMPYYKGNEMDVCSVYGNSFRFYDYILQARERIRELPGEYILIIGDDLLLNPDFHAGNSASLLGLKGSNDFYLDGFVDVSLPACYRGTHEAHSFSTSPPGLDSVSVNTYVPSYEAARGILKSRGLMQYDELTRIRPFFPKWKPDAGFHVNWKIFKARVWHTLNWLKYKLKKYRYSYPVVFGYSDIVCIPKARFDDLCHILEVFSAWGMFVELAIPTALQLLPSAEIRTQQHISHKTGNVWYPQSPDHFASMNSLIDELMASCQNTTKLVEAFPREYLYLHPVKLSRFTH